MASNFLIGSWAKSHPHPLPASKRKFPASKEIILTKTDSFSLKFVFLFFSIKEAVTLFFFKFYFLLFFVVLLNGTLIVLTLSNVEYLGKKKKKKNILPPSQKFKFNFDWEPTEDTSEVRVYVFFVSFIFFFLISTSICYLKLF